MPQAMNLTYGDLIIVEIALIEKLNGIDLATQAGQYFSELLGRVEYNLSQLREAASNQLGEVGPIT